MICKNCNAEIQEQAMFCSNCGASLAEATPVPVQEEQPVAAPVAEPVVAPVVEQPVETPIVEHKERVPAKYKPITAWGYVGLQILYAIPLVGLIFLLIHTFSKKNLVRRGFARSYWCWALLAVIIILLTAIIAVAGILLLGLSLDALMPMIYEMLGMGGFLYY